MCRAPEETGRQSRHLRSPGGAKGQAGQAGRKVPEIKEDAEAAARLEELPGEKSLEFWEFHQLR